MNEKEKEKIGNFEYQKQEQTQIWKLRNCDPTPIAKWCIRSCLERYRKVVSIDGVTCRLESFFAVTGHDIYIRKTTARLDFRFFSNYNNNNDNDNNNNDNNNNNNNNNNKEKDDWRRRKGEREISNLHLHFKFALKCLFVYFTFVIDVHYSQIKNAKYPTCTFISSLP